MSKRLQILFHENEIKEIQRVCREKKMTVSQWVRETVRKNLTDQTAELPEKKIAKILQYSKYQGPTAPITELLDEIERGRNQR